jgi:hypothetical protein
LYESTHNKKHALNRAYFDYRRAGSRAGVIVDCELPSRQIQRLEQRYVAAFEVTSARAISDLVS